MPASRIAIGAAAFVVIVLVALVAVQILMAGRDPNTIHDAGTLPDQGSVCGRTWTRDALGRQLTLAVARSEVDGHAPAVIATGPFAPCPQGPCTTAAQVAPCDTVVYVRVGPDAYTRYALRGGP